MEPKSQDGHDAITHEPTDELTGEQVEQVSGGLAKIGIGVPTLSGAPRADDPVRRTPDQRFSEFLECGNHVQRGSAGVGITRRCR